MNGFSINLYPSDLPRDEKERRLWEVLEFLLHPGRQERSDKMQATGRSENMTNTPHKGHASATSFHEYHCTGGTLARAEGYSSD